jgi:hypothetical protein
MAMADVCRFPMRGYMGLVLIAVGWPLAWVRPDGVRYLWENAFLLLWIGYILTVDAYNWKRTGTSLLSRSPKAFACMFLLSIPGWWLFEFLNLFLQNWHYLYNRPVGSLEYAVRSSVHFSIVIPAVLSTAELWGSFHCLAGSVRWRMLTVTNRRLVAFILAGMVMLVSVIAFPRYCFPLAWVSLYLIFDSLNMLLVAPSLLRYLEAGNWRPVLSLAFGTLTCGFFWEMWNFYSLPKWVYTIPFVDVLHIFEMPVLGYLGYLPFGLEVYALYILLIDISGLKRTSFCGGEGYVQL